MMALDLINVSDAAQVVNEISTQINPSIKNAVASTVLSLAEIQRAFDSDGSLSIFLPQHLLLLPPKAQAVQAPNERTLRYLGELAVLANVAAESLACSSVLAGQGSESDDTGDVALWLGKGDYGPGNEHNVLRVLELTPWLEQGATVTRVELSSYGSTLPSTLSGSVLSPQVQDLVLKINEMSDKYCFRVNSLSTAPLVFFVLLGRFVTSEWGGLMGIGTWSDQ
ncbi:hypothetical protein P691DRAFT_808253 [Macrolepiota fuliginosa MF-IS2]|uniref:Uncharacterized protein n=1 Tax=Macrolepiota fuliginosa MF-IS2 TaxID=1400762 RepID=A0A9P5XH25_9AGAR|nr:hypothetical protein P691DRAFT_808253 [Macrolepiota fuliginosa MF-IS2]